VSVNRIEEPRNQRSRDTRAAILDAAAELLETKGAASVTMAAVARSAGVSRRGLYLHFGSRGQLFTALLGHLNQRLDLAGSVRPVWEAPDAVAALDAWAAHIAGFHTRIVPIVRAVERVHAHDPDAERVRRNAIDGWYRACQKLARALAEEGRLAEPWTPHTAADTLFALMSVEVVDTLTSERGWTIDELAQRLSLLLRRTLTTTSA
jgi:AcrR family transcriptional regulator